MNGNDIVFNGNMPYNGQKAVNSFKIARLFLQESGTFNPMHSRPYTTNMTQGIFNALNDRVANSVGGVMTGSAFTGLASSIITPSATPQGVIAIPNGWTERRIRFVMEVHVHTAFGTEYIYYFQGYTNYLGVSVQGSIDPNMLFIINSFVRVNRNNVFTDHGIMVQDRVTESSHVINGRVMSDHAQTQNTGIHTMRPQDIFTGIQGNYVKNTYQYQGYGNGKNTFIDGRTAPSVESLGSNRSNNIPSNYIANVVSNYQTASNLLNFGQGEENVYDRARQLSLTNDTTLGENLFIRALSNIRGYSGVGQVTEFTIGDLVKLDSEVTSRTNYFTLGHTAKSSLPQAGSTAYWDSVDNESIFATMLSNAIPAIMMEMMFSQLSFVTTNHSIGGIVNTTIASSTSLGNLDMRSYYSTFIARLENEILYDMTHGNQDLFMVSMSVSLFGETQISVSLHGKPTVLYTTPSFCDSLLTPVVTSNTNAYHGVVHDFETMLSQLQSNNPHTNSINTSI